MRRRTFLGLAGLATAGIAIGGYIAFQDFEKFARRIILKDTASLKLDPAEIDKFFKAVSGNKRNVLDDFFPFHHRQLLKWHYYIDNRVFTLPYTVNYNTYRNKVVLIFLLSTNFFTNRMDESKPVYFTSVYDPYQVPCSNPFSNLFYPEAGA